MSEYIRRKTESDPSFADAEAGKDDLLRKSGFTDLSPEEAAAEIMDFLDAAEQHQNEGEKSEE